VQDAPVVRTRVDLVRRFAGANGRAIVACTTSALFSDLTVELLIETPAFFFPPSTKRTDHGLAMANKLMMRYTLVGWINYRRPPDPV